MLYGNGKNSYSEGKQLEIRVKYKPIFYDITVDFVSAQQLYLHFHLLNNENFECWKIPIQVEKSHNSFLCGRSFQDRFFLELYKLASNESLKWIFNQ